MSFPVLTAALLASTAHAGTVTLSASDGVSVRATTYGSGTKGVVLVHDDGRSAEDWKPLATRLGTLGFYVVAVDLPGHGATGGEVTEADYARMALDVSAAAGWLAKKGADEILVVGAGLGGNLGLNAAAATPEVSGVAVLTPTLNARGVKAASAVAGLGKRPLLLVADESDVSSSKAATLLGDRAPGPIEVKLYKGAGSGVRMFNGAPDLEGALVAWLNGSWRTGPAGGRELQSGQVSEVETSGTRLEDRNRR